MVEVGMIGCGFIARYHAMQLALAAEPCALVVCFDPDRERARAFAAETGSVYPDLGTPQVASDVDELLDRVDAAFVCTWTSTHLEVVTAAVRAGVAVFCEKPLGVDLADATDVAAALGGAPQHMVGLVLRSTPAMLTAREFVHRGSSGAVMNVVFRDDQYLPVGGMYESTWRSDASLAGSGVLLEHSIHDLDIIEWLVGPVVDVAARTRSFHDLGLIEDSVAAMGAFAGGGSFTLSSVWHDVGSRPSRRRIEVFCEGALVTIDGEIFGPVTIEDASGTTTYGPDDLAAFLAEAGVLMESAEQQFLRSVAMGSGNRLRPDGRDALRAHTVVDAMYRSAAAHGTPMPVPVPGP